LSRTVFAFSERQKSTAFADRRKEDRRKEDRRKEDRRKEDRRKEDPRIKAAPLSHVTRNRPGGAP